MATETLNPPLLHLFKMYSFPRAKSALESIKKAPINYYAEQIYKEMDALWTSGKISVYSTHQLRLALSRHAHYTYSNEKD